MKFFDRHPFVAVAAAGTFLVACGAAVVGGVQVVIEAIKEEKEAKKKSEEQEGTKE